MVQIKAWKELELRRRLSTYKVEKNGKAPNCGAKDGDSDGS